MNRFGKLLSWELHRFIKIYIVLLIATLLSQFTGVLVYAHSFMSQANAALQTGSMTAGEYALHYSAASFASYSRSFWFKAPIVLCIATLLLYVFLIWYRDWFGKSAFIYRLLMLPTARINVYLAKAISILLLVLGLVAFQLLILIPEIHLFNTLIPSDLRNTVSMTELIRYQSLFLNILAPPYLMQLILYYAAVFMGVVVIFTAILLERSFKLKGIVAGVVYGIAAGIVFLSPILITAHWYPNYFFPSEVVTMEIIVGLIVIGVSLWFSSYLLKKRVTV